MQHYYTHSGKNVAKLARLQKPGQSQGWPGWPIPTALNAMLNYSEINDTTSQCAVGFYNQNKKYQKICQFS